ncbi:TPA: hypothetical protein F7064_13255 [Legionella pneumophila]|nr:hypothetical protein [Legionella pneumophila]HAU1644274.1 hypothetical protein [Legionella pneumophila]HAU3632858.1 hypothetical protein [Legionella pneumophila]HAU4023025.1 hypothetical protein [Legionella pneumophila]HDO7866078.1 hypothetical protein [Legionella pneumophila]
MLNPNKYSHPDSTVINVSLLLLMRLKKKRTDEYSRLRLYIKDKVKGGASLFLPALSFLYLLGKIEYRMKTDTIEYIE